MGKTREVKPKPKLEASEEATVPETIEAVGNYLQERYGKLSDKELSDKVRDAQARLREIEADLDTAEEGLADALVRDEADIAEADLDAPVVAKNYQRERERLAKLIPQRWRLRKMVAELDLAQRLRTAERKSKEACELYEEIQPLEQKLRELQDEVRLLQDKRTAAVHIAREATAPMKHLVSQVVELQRPDMSGLVRYVGLK